MLSCNDWAHSHHCSGIRALARCCERFYFPTRSSNGAIRRSTLRKWCIGDVRASGRRRASSQYDVCLNGIDVNACGEFECAFAFIDGPQCTRCYDGSNIRLGIRAVRLLKPNERIHQFSVVSSADVHLAGVLHALGR